MNVLGTATHAHRIPTRLLQKILLIRVSESTDDFTTILNTQFNVNKKDFSREVRESLLQVVWANFEVFRSS